MKVSIAEFTDSINTMNPILERKQTVLEQLEKAVNGFIEEKILQGKSYESARGYFREIHLPALRGMILLYEEIRSANTRCLSDIYSQVTSDYSMKMDTGGMEYFIYEARRTLNELATLEQESPFIQQQRANLQRIETEINKVIDFHSTHAGHYDTAMMYMDDVRIALAQFQHKSYNSKSKIYTYEVKNKIGSVHINKKWKLYEYKKKIKSYIKEDGQVDYKNLNHEFWNREDGYFEGNWWQDPEKLAEATYVLKQEAGAYDGINIVDMISQYQEGEPNPRFNTLQALANDQRVSYYDISVMDSIIGNLHAMGLKYDETKGTISVEEINALAKREKNIKFREVGNWLENGGQMFIDGVMILVIGACLVKAGSSSKSKTSSVSKTSNTTRKYKVGRSPKVKSCTYPKGGYNARIWDKITGTADNMPNTEIPATFQIDLSENENYVNPTTGTNTIWTNANATEHIGEYIGRFGAESETIGVRSQAMLKSYSASLNEAMIDLSSKSLGRYFGTYGNWEIGINTETGVVYHARMIN